MNIYAKYGDKVRYLGKGGYDIDRVIGNKLLTVGEIYTVEKTDVANFVTHVFLKEFPNIAFNTVLFEDFGG